MPRLRSASGLRKNVSVHYMVIERYLAGSGPVYERAAACGRVFDVWFQRWDELVSFELYPVITSAEAAARAGT